MLKVHFLTTSEKTWKWHGMMWKLPRSEHVISKLYIPVPVLRWYYIILTIYLYLSSTWKRSLNALWRESSVLAWHKLTMAPVRYTVHVIMYTPNLCAKLIFWTKCWHLWLSVQLLKYMLLFHRTNAGCCEFLDGRTGSHNFMWVVTYT